MTQASRVRAGLLLAAFLLAACAAPRSEVPRPVSYALQHPERTALGRLAADRLPAAGESGFHLLADGAEALLARLALADAAERSLDLQYFILRDDTTAGLLLQGVLRAAQRGVLVRLLLDDLHSGERAGDVAALAAHPNITVRLFNPFPSRGGAGVGRLLEYLGDSARLNRRMHNKLWIADNAAAILGGRNLGNEYFDADEQVNFTDLDVLVAGPAVRALSAGFDEYWNSDWSVAVPASAEIENRGAPLRELEAKLSAQMETLRSSAYWKDLGQSGRAPGAGVLEAPLAAASAVVLYDPPGRPEKQASGKPGTSIGPKIRLAIESARAEVILISPYFIPSQQGVELLGALVKRGVRVRVLTNSLASTDVPAVHGGYARYRDALLAAGVELSELRSEAQAPPAHSRRSLGSGSGASLHAKAVVVDRRTVFLGSMNLDPRSRLANLELGLIIDSAEVGRAVGALFDTATHPRHAFSLKRRDSSPGALAWTGEENGRPATYDSEPLASLWRRASAALLSFLLPEEML